MTATPAAAGDQPLRISQVYGGGGNSGATYTNDFIELFNAGATAVDLSDWSVQYASSTGSTWQVTTLSGSIAPGGYYLIQEAQGAGGTTPLPTPDAIGTIAMGGTNGKVALVNSTTALSGACPTGLIDLVGYGSANCYEGAAAPALSNTTAALRANGGCTDADNNAADFTAGAPTPRNTASPTHSCGASGGALTVAKTGPAAVLPDAAYTYTLTVQNTTGAALTNLVLSDTLPSTVAYASSNPAGTWNAASHTITWTEATLADATTLTYTLAVTAPTTWGAVSNADYAAWATEWVTPTSGSPVATNVKGACDTIEAIQSNHDADGNSLCDGSATTVEGIVYAVYTSAGYAIADAAGPWHGLYVYTGSGGAKPIVGQRVRVTGTVDEYFNMTEIASGSSFTVVSSGNTPYAASVVAVADIATGAATAESYESVLVEVNNVTVDNASLGNGEWSVAAGGSSVRVDDLGYAYTPSVGDYLSVVRGMLNYSFSAFKIEPRAADDVVPGTFVGLLVSKTGPVTATAGSAFTYTLVMENQTATQLNNLVVSDTLPLSATFAAATPAGTWDAASHTITWTEATLAHDTALTYTIVVTAPTESVILNNREYAAWASNWLTRETGAPVNTAVLAAPGDLTPIAAARAAGAGWSGSLQGKVTVPPGRYRGNAFVIQDDTGGLYIYTGNFSLPALALGDTVRVTGTLTLYSGQLQMDPMTGIANLGSGTPPDPLLLATGAVAANEGWLARITGAATWSGTPPTPGASNFTLNANDGSGSVQVFVDLDTGIDMRSYTSGQQLTIIGFVGNYNGTKQVMPRYQSDVWDMLPPQVTATYPTANATDVYPYFPLTATFSKALDAATVTTETFTLVNAGGAVAGAVSYDAGTRTATFGPYGALAAQTRYTATLTTGIAETHGIPMAADYVWSFTTGDADTTAPTITGRTPAPDAADVSISVNVVVTFSEAIRPTTLLKSVTLTGPYGAVPTDLNYDAATFVMTLNPHTNLLPTARYTVTVGAAVADWAGNTLGADSVWGFETAVEPPMYAYHGDIHNHTSYSDGSGTPTQALATGRDAGDFDFMAITDHSYAVSDAEWADTLAAVEAATVDGTFVALRGFEYTQGAEGHINVYNTVRHAVRTNVAGCTTCDYTPNLEAGVTVQGFYPWLAVTGTHALDAAGTVMQFNHPGWINFNDWTFHPEVGDTARLEEVGNGSGTSYAFSEDEYIRSLDYGWKVGATNNADTHSFYWGTNTPHRTGVWMPNLTKADLLEALRERRTFATEDVNATLYLKGNGAWMGTEIPNTGSVIFEVAYADPDGEIPAALQLISYGGQVVAEMTPVAADFVWNLDLTITPGVHYYYVKATQADGDRIVSSPVWTIGDENVAITDVVIQPTIPTIHNPSLLTARVTNRVAAPRTVTVTLAVNGVNLGAPVAVTVPANDDAYANFTWQPTATGIATVTATLLDAPVGDNPDDNVGQLVLNVTDELLPLILIDAGHGNTNALGREMRMFIQDLSNHQYNVLKNLDELTAADLNTTTVKLLIITAPELAYTAAERAAIADFVAGGGSLWLCNIADYTGKVAWANTVADRLNAILDSIETRIGANIAMRLNDDEVIDANDNNGYVFGVLWSDFPGAATTSIGVNVETLASWSLSSIRGRTVNDPLTAATPGVQIIVQGDLDEGYGDAPWRNPNHTSNEDADNQGDAYIYNPTWVYPAGAPANPLPVPMAAVSDLPGDAGRIMLYGDANDPFTTFAYTAGDGRQNELFNLEAVMWLLGQPLQKSTIAEARADAELNNTPDNLDKLVWVEGKITAAYNEFFNVLYVQDDTGGITVHAPAGDISATQYTRGTTVRVVGTLGAYNGDTEIEFFEAEMVQVIAPSAGEVAPRPFTTGAAARESNEGWLAQITGTITSKVGDEALIVDDGSGPIRAFLDGYNGDFSDLVVGDIVTVKGLISEDGDGRRIRVRNYQMHPAIADDVTQLGALADVTLTKTVTPEANIFPGDEVTYTLTLHNAGDTSVTGITLTDALPWEMNFAAWVTQSGASVNDDIITWSGDLADGETVVVSFRAAVRSDSFFIVHPVVNTATYAVGALVGGSDSATFILAGVVAPTLTKEVATPAPVLPGESVTYTLTLNNPAGVAGGVLLTDILPAALDFGGWVAQNGASVSDDVITWSGDLASGANLVISFRATLHADPALYGQTITNTATFTAHNTLPGSAEAAFTVGSSTVGDVTITKDVVAGAAVDAGGVVTYTVTLNNDGDAPATGVLLTDTLPVEVDFGGWIAREGATVNADVITWSGDLADGDQIAFVFTATVRSDVTLDGRTVVNTAHFTWNGETAGDVASFTLRQAFKIFLPLVGRSF